MKNPHGVPPTRYMKRKESKYAIVCNPKWGPIFGCRDICIGDNCNKEDSCFIDNNNNNHGYECDPQYKRSYLFANIAGSNFDNKFIVLDYEVYCIDNYKDYIYNLCKYPNIIWEYIETKDISEESLKQFDDDVELLNELDVIHKGDDIICLKISKYYLKNASELLINSNIVDIQYDSYLMKWTGYYKWKLIYRTSEHGYTGESFHEYCDNVKGPTLIVIKSSKGWIFGGYTTQSWKSKIKKSIYIMK